MKCQLNKSSNGGPSGTSRNARKMTTKKDHTSATAVISNILFATPRERLVKVIVFGGTVVG